MSDTAGVIAPPPLLFAGTLALGLALDFGVWRAPTGLPEMLRWPVAGVALAGAAVLLAGALGKLRKAGTPVEPWVPTTAVVTTGVYAWSRNPIYAGMALAYVGLALVFDSVIALLLVAPLLGIVQWGVIEREERYLCGKFGDEYRQYCRTVRRWL